jgi:hypothetical protein
MPAAPSHILEAETALGLPELTTLAAPGPACARKAIAKRIELTGCCLVRPLAPARQAIGRQHRVMVGITALITATLPHQPDGLLVAGIPLPACEHQANHIFKDVHMLFIMLLIIS